MTLLFNPNGKKDSKSYPTY